MKNLCFLITLLLLSVPAQFLRAEQWPPSGCDPNTDEIGQKTVAYFNNLFDKLKNVAEKDPNVETFRSAMRPVAESVKGFYGGTLIDPDFVIRQVYYPSHFLARGFDLKKVKELTDFYSMMKENPAPQLSEPGHGSIVQPRLIAMRYPVIIDGKLKNIISMMVRTEAFLDATGLDKCKAYKIICRGKLAEGKGKLSENYTQVKLILPSTDWLIQYQK
jgi:hypothetical protein